MSSTHRAVSPAVGVHARKVELECCMCLRAFTGSGKRENRVGPKPEHAECWSTRRRIDSILWRLRAAIRDRGHCQFCAEARAKGSKYCGRHQYRREGCEGCGGKVRRNEGQGNQPRRCLECRSGKRKSFGESSAGKAGS